MYEKKIDECAEYLSLRRRGTVRDEEARDDLKEGKSGSIPVQSWRKQKEKKFTPDQIDTLEPNIVI